MSNKDKDNEIPFESYAHFLSGTIDSTIIEAASRWLLHAKFNKIEKPLTLHINSEGGNLGDAIGLTDLMLGVGVPVRTLAYGNLMSAAFVIFAAGEKGYRAVGKNTTIMIHQFNDEMGGKYHDMRAYAKECDRYHHKMAKILADHSNLSVKDVKTKFLRPTDVWLSAEELVEYGVADIIF
jgi:ATP-dependent Clp protease protease subunit